MLNCGAGFSTVAGARRLRRTHDRRGGKPVFHPRPPSSARRCRRTSRPVSDSRGSGAAGARCTNRRHNAHVTESRVVLYRWHPWHGRAVCVVGAVVKGGYTVYRCVLEPNDDSRSLEIPQWMFDAAACCRIALSASPAVTCEALHELRRLIESASRADGHAVLQAGHLAIPNPGGAYATRESSALGRSAGAVSPASIDSAVGGLAAGDASTGAVVAGAAAPKSSTRSSRRAARPGDAR